MPISFEQPGPYSQAISQGYGAVLQEDKDREFLLRARQHQGGGGGGGGGNGGGFPSQRPAGIIDAGGGGGGGAQDQTAALTWAENLRMQKLQQARDAIQNDPNLSDVDRADALTLVNTTINPLELRQQRSRAELIEAQKKEYMDQHARETSMMNMDATARAQHVRDHSVDLGNGNSVYVDPMGKTHIVRNERMAAQQENASQMRTHDAAEDTQFRHALSEVEKQVLPVGQNGNLTAPTPEQTQRIREMMLQRGFHSHDLAEHQNIRQELRTQQPMVGRPEDRWTPEQREQVGRFSSIRADIEREGGQTTWTTNQRRELGQAEELFRRYGTERRMPPQVRQHYVGILMEIRRQMTLPWGPQNQQQQAPQQQPAPRPGSNASDAILSTW